MEYCMPHKLEVFVGNCAICKEVIDIVTVGKCGECIMDVISVDSKDEVVVDKLRRYDVRSVPTIIVDGRIKVVGRPQFPWFCSDDFYQFLSERYPLLSNIRFNQA
jgi:hypothetical protein